MLIDNRFDIGKKKKRKTFLFLLFCLILTMDKKSIPSNKFHARETTTFWLTKSFYPSIYPSVCIHSILSLWTQGRILYLFYRTSSTRNKKKKKKDVEMSENRYVWFEWYVYMYVVCMKEGKNKFLQCCHHVACLSIYSNCQSNRLKS